MNIYILKNIYAHVKYLAHISLLLESEVTVISVLVKSCVKNFSAQYFRPTFHFIPNKLHNKTFSATSQFGIWDVVASEVPYCMVAMVKEMHLPGKIAIYNAMRLLYCNKKQNALCKVGIKLSYRCIKVS